MIMGCLLVFTPLALFKSDSGPGEPDFHLEKRDGNIEIRDYGPSITAGVKVESDFNDAINTGFMKLFNYISGKNTNRSKIKMTIPVTEQQVSSSEKIPMTAPVTSEKSGNAYLVSFIMPSNYTLDTLPIPEDKSITFEAIPAHKAAVISFSGRLNEQMADKKIVELKDWLSKNDLRPKSGFITAQYDPPWIPGFMRRNEVMVNI